MRIAGQVYDIRWYFTDCTTYVGPTVYGYRRQDRVDNSDYDWDDGSEGQVLVTNGRGVPSVLPLPPVDCSPRGDAEDWLGHIHSTPMRGSWYNRGGQRQGGRGSPVAPGSGGQRQGGSTSTFPVAAEGGQEQGGIGQWLIVSSQGQAQGSEGAFPFTSGGGSLMGRSSLFPVVSIGSQEQGGDGGVIVISGAGGEEQGLGGLLVIASAGGQKQGGAGGFSNHVPDSARVTNSTTQAITTGAGQQVTFDTETWDTNSLHSTVTNTARLTAASNGYYMVTGSVIFAANATGVRGVSIQKNGATIYGQSNKNVASGTFTEVADCSAIVDLNAGDYVVLVAAQTSGGNLNISNQQFGMHQI